MQYHGVPAVRIHGDMAQYERTGALEAMASERMDLSVLCKYPYRDKCSGTICVNVHVYEHDRTSICLFTYR